MKKQRLILLGAFTLVGFSLLGWVIVYFWGEQSMLHLLTGGRPLWIQLAIGSLFGGFTAWIGWQIILWDIMAPVRDFYTKMFAGYKLSVAEILFISFCAGVGEEILFRGAIQPLLGLWLTSILFVAIHGYLNPTNWRITLYGVYMCLVIAGIGRLFALLGIYSAISAHIVIDIILLTALTKDTPEAPTSKS